jgi:hypothetical protein
MIQTARKPGFLEKVSGTFLKQSAIGTPSGNLTTDLAICFPLKNSAIPQLTHNTMARKDLVGLEDDAKVDIYRKGLTWNPAFEAGINTVLWHAMFGMGSAATTGAGPYAHTIKRMTDRHMPVTQIVHEGHHSGKRSYYDLAVDNFTISGQGDDENTIEVAANWVGSGVENTSPTHTSPTVTYEHEDGQSEGGVGRFRR